MLQILLIGLGCALGGITRFLVSNGVHTLVSRDFPLGTLVVNISGSLVMGILFVLIMERMGDMSANLRALLMVGFLGGYTTFSSFSIETISLIENGELLLALCNMIGSCILCVLAAWIGVVLARQI